MTKENCKHNHLIMKDWVNMAVIFDEDSEKYVHHFKAECTDCWKNVLIPCKRDWLFMPFERWMNGLIEDLKEVWDIELNEEERIIKITPFEWQNIKIDEQERKHLWI